MLLSESESSIYEAGLGSSSTPLNPPGVIMRSRGERISITSWGMPDNGRASDGSLTVRLKQPSMPYPSRYISIG